MKYLSFSLLTLALFYTPASLAANTNKKCFGYPCCKGNKVVLSDDYGQWGIEDGYWCGINTAKDDCFSVALGYPCCTENRVVYTDESGKWGVEDGKWCGVDTSKDECFSISLGYKCCKSCDVVVTDKSGKWGVESNEWCGIKDSCNSDIVQDNGDFDFTFLKMENNKTNMLYSPLSIKYALKMLQEGAANNTYDEINKVIGNTELTKYTSIGDNLSLANGLFIRDSFYDYVKSQYTDLLKKKYDADVMEDPFKDATNFNQWIEDKTLGIIKNLLKDEAVQDPLTKIILANALAIDMKWYDKFDFKKTGGRNFYIDNQRITATTMYKKETRSSAYSFYVDDDITVLTLDLEKYQGLQFEFMAIMPNQNLTNYIENVTKETINQIDDELRSASATLYGVNISIPKFKFSYDLKLKDDLKKLGIKDVFDRNKSDLSKMVKENMLDQNLYVSDAIHKADIEFTEEGVKAAAVTVFPMAPGSAPPQKEPVNIFINKPFMFIIREKSNNNVWFTGNVYEQNLWENDEPLYEPKLNYIY